MFWQFLICFSGTTITILLTGFRLNSRKLLIENSRSSKSFSSTTIRSSTSGRFFEKLKEVTVKNITLIYERTLNKKTKLKPKIKIKNVELEKE